MAEELRATRIDARTAEAVRVDAGLRSYMLQVYNYMASGLFLTGLIAAAVAYTPSVFNVIFGTPLKWVVMLAPIGIVFFLSARLHRMSAAAAQAWFWGFAALFGLSLASIFALYTGLSITRVFFITAGTFGAMSLYGYTTKTDLSKFGSFLIMGLIGILIAGLVNIFIASSALQFAISVIGVIVFVGLTAWDTQRIKEEYSAQDDTETAGKKAIFGALQLYLDFINLFIMLLQLLGERK
ncbi:MAG: Bax inhibitor-1/YccA family protein [Alphaproteobacteria bacterium]|nr:Bax inhibitor-1/YccA family protein [Alphaproteobacteria bacterium]